MRIKLNGTILESNNDLVTEQWKKKGYKEYREKTARKQGKEPDGADAGEVDEVAKEQQSMTD